MSNYYTEFVTEMIIELIEEGDLTLREIANTCNVSLFYVKKVRNNYDIFYSKIYNLFGSKRE